MFRNIRTKVATIPANNLRYYRIMKLMTQRELAKASGVSQVTISFTETMQSEPMGLTKQKLARALKVAPEKIFPPRGRGK
ncbi:helix-turn-helix domain-containing protein [Patescibacteria group bacterium]|nr:helix-turn-helix domain-containing protein [Patescibacteria group bacterium]